MGEAYRKIFWGILILTFHINLGPIQILPSFVGYLLMVSACSMLLVYEDMASYKTAKMAAVLLSILSLLDRAAFYLGVLPRVPYTFLGALVFGVLEILFFYHILGGKAQRLEMDEDQAGAEKTFRLQRKITVLLSVQTILYYGVSLLYLQSFLPFYFLYGIFMRMYLMSIFAGLRKEEDGGRTEENESIDGTIGENHP